MGRAATNDMDTNSAGVTGGNPVPTTIAARATPIAEHTYGVMATIMDVKTGNAADAWSAYIAFDWATLYILMECWTNSLAIQFSTGVDSVGNYRYEDVREVIVSRPALIPFTAKGFRVRNFAAGFTSRYQITGMGTGF